MDSRLKMRSAHFIYSVIVISRELYGWLCTWFRLSVCASVCVSLCNQVL